MRIRPYTTVFANWQCDTVWANEEMEVFSALWLAKDEFWHRANDPTNPHYYWVDKASCLMDVYLKDDSGTYEPYCRFTIGPRGGIRKEFY